MNQPTQTHAPGADPRSAVAATRAQRVAILDDHALVREALAAHLRDHGFDVVLAAAAIDELLRALDTSAPELVVVDLGLGGEPDALSGLQVLAHLANHAPRLKAVVVTANENPDVLAQCYALGAYAFLPKRDASPALVVDVLHAAARGQRHFPTRLTPPVSQLPATPAQTRISRQLDTLTARERQVLGLIADGHDNLKIAAMLDISERTVKSHVAAIYRKLSLENRVQLALRGRDLGLNARTLAET